jgi:hypothetical protein
MKSLAQQAKQFAPIGLCFNRQDAATFWANNHFVDEAGNLVYAKHLHTTRGSFSVEFADGSILSQPHWNS